MPAAKELGSRPDVIHTIFGNSAKFSLLKKAAEIKACYPSTFGTLYAKTLAEEIEIEFSDGAVEGELFQEIAMLAGFIPIPHEVAGGFHTQDR
jgi:hypothetical protein